ncbi:hypothetical protein niasHT_000807 [Heterodera trifolii]|uniref:Uncharacterized protein n=1 Tax=Heterodera trifolii TaxID=157864 RepID=A0ABD2MA54_9BILA
MRRVEKNGHGNAYQNSESKAKRQVKLNQTEEAAAAAEEKDGWRRREVRTAADEENVKWDEFEREGAKDVWIDGKGGDKSERMRQKQRKGGDLRLSMLHHGVACPDHSLKKNCHCFQQHQQQQQQFLLHHQRTAAHGDSSLSSVATIRCEPFGVPHHAPFCPSSVPPANRGDDHLHETMDVSLASVAKDLGFDGHDLTDMLAKLPVEEGFEGDMDPDEDTLLSNCPQLGRRGTVSARAGGGSAPTN